MKTRPEITELRARILCDVDALAAMTVGKHSFEDAWPDERAAGRYAKRTRDAAEPLNSILREIYRQAEPLVRSHEKASQAGAKMRRAARPS